MTKSFKDYVCCRTCRRCLSFELPGNIFHQFEVGSGCVDFWNATGWNSVHDLAKHYAILEDFFIRISIEHFLTQHCFDPSLNLGLLRQISFAKNLLSYKSIDVLQKFYRGVSIQILTGRGIISFQISFEVNNVHLKTAFTRLEMFSTKILNRSILMKIVFMCFTLQHAVGIWRLKKRVRLFINSYLSKRLFVYFNDLLIEESFWRKEFNMLHP